MKKLILLLVLGIFLFSFVSALETPIYPLDKPLDLKVYCVNNGWCSSSAICNINVDSPTNKQLVSGQNMTNQISFHNYTLTPNESGTYQVRGVCTEGILSKKVSFDFKATPSGKSSSTGESILYIGMSIIFFGLLLLMFYLIMALPYENEKDDRGSITGINKLKYLKVTLIAFVYPIVILLLNFLNGIAQNFASLEMFGGIFGFLFEILLRAAWVYTVVIMVWIIVLLIKDSNLKKVIKVIPR